MNLYGNISLEFNMLKHLFLYTSLAITFLFSTINAKSNYPKYPKTQLVRGYFKKDGTLVPPHFRSPPHKNPYLTN